jgi:hypothetical protein
MVAVDTPDMQEAEHDVAQRQDSVVSEGGDIEEHA